MNDEQHESLSERVERLEHELAERDRRCAELEARTERFRQIIEAHPAAAWVYDTVLGAIEYVSPAYEEIWGRPLASAYDIDGDAFESVHADDRQRVKKAFGRTLERREPFDEVYRIVRPDGSVRWLHDRAVLVESERGTRSLLVGVGLDVTDAKHAEERFRALFEQSSDAHLICDESLVVLDGNDAARRLLGLLCGEKISAQSLTRFLPRAQRDSFRTLLSAIQERGRRLEQPLERASGSTFPAELTVSPLRLDDRRVYLIGLRDLAERKREEALLVRAKEQAESATQAKSAFLANMSHEIRTPMTAILGFAEELLSRDVGLEERREALQTILQNGRYLLRLINDILDLSKIEAGKLEVERVPSSIPEIALGVRSLMEPRATEKGLRFEMTCENRVPERIHSDPLRLRQILINLIGNAVKFTGSGSVAMRLRHLPCDGDLPDRLEFAVVDTGIGMSEEQVECIFQPFSQAETATSRKFGGTGLGLAISQRLAQLLGGAISVESRLGRGSEFRLTVPTGPIEGVPRIGSLSVFRKKSADELPVSETLRARVLVAEDTPVNQKLICRILEKAGAQVEVAENGQQAVLSALSSLESGRPFDLILMDMQMPVLDGYEATRELREKGYEAPIVALTANAMSSDRERCLAAGCDGYAMKPINRSQLFAEIRRHVRA